jgi:hypothetical protein
MTRLVLHGSVLKKILSGSIFKELHTGAAPRKILMIAAWAMACVWTQAPACAQGGGVPRGGRPAGGGHVGSGVRVAAPPVVAPPISRGAMARPRRMAGPTLGGVGTPVSVQTLRFRPGPNHGFRRPFFGARSFRIGRDFRFNSYSWWPGCGPVWSWEFGCSQVSPYRSGFENYVTTQSYENPAYVYGYGSEGRDLVWLYLKDGTVFGVSDYWFVNGEVHFNAVGEGGVPSREQVIGADELDLQKTSDVNTTRGFRVVMRDEPWEKYLKDHPDLTPPPLVPPQKN